jgi:two-component system, NtrC family, nitrogen regulation sensor histidine kinase NtrY
VRRPSLSIRARLCCLVLAAAGSGAAAALGAAHTDLGWAMSAACGAAVGFGAGALAARALLGSARDLVRAVTDGLASFSESDFTVRVHDGGAGELGELARRYNRMGDALRAQHDDLYQKELLLETVLDAAPLVIVLVTEASRVAYANGAARAFFGADDRLEGRTLDQLLATEPEELRAAVASGRDALVSLERGGEIDAVVVTRRSFRLNTQPHILVTIRSLTRELARNEAEHYKSAVRLISHELNNSLAPISSLVHSGRLLLDKPAQRARLDTVFDTIEERSLHLTRFLGAYAELARLPAPSPERVALGPFLARLRALAPFGLAAAPDDVGFFDPVQMQQLLLNLLKNAVEAGSPEDSIEVALARLPSGELSLRVRDRGGGLSDEAMRKALLPFYTTKQSGSGLGLALCREIAIAHGGTLVIRRREGGGAEVECRLPPSPAAT